MDPQGPTNPSSTGSDDRDELSPRRLARSGVAGGLYAAAVIAALAIAAALIASQAGAAGWFQRHAGLGGHGHDGDRMGRHAEFAIDWVLSEIEASDEQAAKIKQLVGSTLEDLHGLRAQRDEHHEQLRAMLGAETVDRDALEAFRQEQLAKLDDASRRLVDTVIAVAAELTPEQRQQLTELADHHPRRGHHGRGWHH